MHLHSAFEFGSNMDSANEKTQMPDFGPVQNPDWTREPVSVRKKGLSIRKWLLIDIHGGAQVIEAGKLAIMRRTGLPARDLRILDPVLSSPPRIISRERAIVVNLEHIKAIISAQEVLLLNSKDPAVAPLVANFQRRLSETKVPGGGGGGSKTDQNDPFRSMLRNRFASSSAAELTSLKLESKVSENNMGPKALPFEFRALEICLEAACSCLDAEASTLEKEAYPALDELTSHISTLNLERVRQIKSRLVAISGRVEKVRDELEQLLDDDGDMADMYLTDKLLAQQLDGPPSPTSVDGNDESATYFETERERESVADKGSPKRTSTSTSGSNAAAKHLDVEELEMLLEAYFVQVDGILNNLSTLREYVDDTEDYINMMLDDKQNHLLQMEVMLMTITLVINSFVVVVALFGMNIHIEVFHIGTFSQFLWTIGGSATALLTVYAVIIAWYKRKHLME